MENIKDDKYYIDKAKENIDAIVAYKAIKSYDEIVSSDIC